MVGSKPGFDRCGVSRRSDQLESLPPAMPSSKTSDAATTTSPSTHRPNIGYLRRSMSWRSPSEPRRAIVQPCHQIAQRNRAQAVHHHPPGPGASGARAAGPGRPTLHRHPTQPAVGGRLHLCRDGDPDGVHRLRLRRLLAPHHGLAHRGPDAHRAAPRTLWRWRCGCAGEPVTASTAWCITPTPALRADSTGRRNTLITEVCNGTTKEADAAGAGRDASAVGRG